MLNFKPAAIVGFLGGVALFVGAIFLTSETPLIYLNLHGAMIVVGGTVAASLVAFPYVQLKSAFARAWQLIKKDHPVSKGDLERFIRVAGLRQQNAMAKIEEEIENANSPFVRTGLQLVIDGLPSDDIASVLELRMKNQELIERNEALVFKTMATFTPAFGLAATLIGLVNMLFMMGQGATAQHVGTNMSLALIATFYGVVLANGFLRPLATKIELKTQDRLRAMAIIVEVIRCIAEGRGPSHVREVLFAIVADHGDEMGLRDTLVTMTEADLYRSKA
ncbi:MAG: MotA/TolQ/ExbB proton channel family protein [Rhodospirillaceae bacterium]|nr:MotA/TolQ/ExbB proton channel family protein [Rhodospirillaceae bacterium]